jgi:hypothetical protein
LGIGQAVHLSEQARLAFLERRHLEINIAHRPARLEVKYLIGRATKTEAIRRQANPNLVEPWAQVRESVVALQVRHNAVRGQGAGCEDGLREQLRRRGGRLEVEQDCRRNDPLGKVLTGPG